MRALVLSALLVSIVVPAIYGNGDVRATACRAAGGEWDRVRQTCSVK